jgi:glycerophosphoryl diester phosphodiesterase
MIRMFRWLVAVVLTLGMAPMISAGQTAMSAAAVIARPGPLVIAHRGSSLRAPENTLPAFRLALAARADLIELDYHHAQEGVPVCLHDHTLDRTTDALARWGGKAIPVSGKSLAELAGLDAGTWFAPTFAGTPLPTLIQALEVIQAGGCTLIERKAGDAATLVDLLRQRGWLEQVVIQSFDWAFVRDVHRLAPAAVLGALGPPSSWKGRKLADPEKTLSAEFIDEMAGLGARIVVWNRQLTPGSIRRAHQRGLRVWVYTIDDPELAAELVALGVDGIITNDPESMSARLRPGADERPNSSLPRRVPKPLADHSGNIFLEGEEVRVAWPRDLAPAVDRWRAVDDRGRVVRAGGLAAGATSAAAPLDLGLLGVGWYRVEFGSADDSQLHWTTAAVLKPLAVPTPFDSPVAVDSATAWFARDDRSQQQRLANLAALAGVNWVRDRLRWGEIQPQAGALVDRVTTYDTAAEIQHAAGLKVLQVFHDTPPWAREESGRGGRFAPDLRHAYALGRALAERFRGKVQAWEPWNEANVATFGGHTVDEMTAWQKAAWLGFKAGDPDVMVGWNVSTAVPTWQHTEGLRANKVWPYYDTYNLHTYDWSHAYADLWAPAREATWGRPLWITEADRGTPHLKNPPWYDQDLRLERLKAEWIAQSYACSLFAGARRHFHFILGHYQEPNGVQFGLLRLDLTPRPAYVALAAVGRLLAGAQVLGRIRLDQDLQVYAFRARPDGHERDVLVVWAERDVDWAERGQALADWPWPNQLRIEGVVDYLGRSLGQTLPSKIGSAPLFVFLPRGQAATLPLEPPPALSSAPKDLQPSPVVLRWSVPESARLRVEDLPWSEGYAYQVAPDEPLGCFLEVYNFGASPVEGNLQIAAIPEGWHFDIEAGPFKVEALGRQQLKGSLRIASSAPVRDGWVVVRAEGDGYGPPVAAARFLVRTR